MLVISKLQLTDFKAFHKLDIELRPITLFLGPNNAGKSSIISPLRLLAQTVQSEDPTIPLLLDGSFGDFGTYRDIVHGNHRGRPMRIGIGIKDGPLVGINRRKQRPPSSPLLDLEFKYRTVRRQLVLRESTLREPRRHLLTASLSRDATRHLITRVGGQPVPSAQRSQVAANLAMYNFMPRVRWHIDPRDSDNWLQDKFGSRLEDLMNRSSDAFYSIYRSLLDVDYLSAMRQPPERTYHQTGVARSRIGAGGENWAGLLALDSSRPSERRRLLPELVKWLKKAGLASEVRLHWLSDRHYEVQVQHPISGEYENLADVGQANSQVLPVLIGGLSLSAGSTYIVEEPEIHLHPGAQAELGDFFCSLHEDGINSIVETHSEYLVLRLQQHVAVGRLSPDDIAFYYVYARGGKKVARKLTLDKDARFIQSLGGGFFPQKLKEAKQLARLRGSRDENRN